MISLLFFLLGIFTLKAVQETINIRPSERLEKLLEASGKPLTANELSEIACIGLAGILEHLRKLEYQGKITKRETGEKTIQFGDQWLKVPDRVEYEWRRR